MINKTLKLYTSSLYTKSQLIPANNYFVIREYHDGESPGSLKYYKLILAQVCIIYISQ